MNEHYFLQGTVAQKQGMLELALNTRCQGSYRKTKIIDYHLCARQMKDTNAACAGSIGSPLLVCFVIKL